jgi:hypothetical protein
VPPEHEVRGSASTVITEFDRGSATLYDPSDAARGYLEVADRQGKVQHFPIVSIALGVATTERGSFADHREMVEVATEMKSYLKRQADGLAYAVDGRTDEPDPLDRSGPDRLAGETRVPGR